MGLQQFSPLKQKQTGQDFNPSKMSRPLYCALVQHVGRLARLCALPASNHLQPFAKGATEEKEWLCAPRSQPGKQRKRHKCLLIIIQSTVTR